MNEMSHKKIKRVKGTAIPKPEDKQNTDDIIPARFLKEITFKNMGEYVYFNEREQQGEDHPFENPAYDGGNILIAGAEYGSGSSREHAPQGLSRYGIEAIIAESFADIFIGNCPGLGVVGVTASREDISGLVSYVRENPSTQVEVDLESKSIAYDDKKIKCEIPESQRQAFIKGQWDELALLRKNQTEVDKAATNLPYLNFR